MKFSELADKIHKGPYNNADQRILSLDPGETTGWALWENRALIKCGQLDTKTLRNAIEPEDSLENLLTGGDKLAMVVVEDYRIYEWKAAEHAWSSVHTIQLIGLIKTYCIQEDIPFILQSAQIAKQFCTDDKLLEWGFWEKGMRHARDAIRHGAYYILFNSRKEIDSEGYVKAPTTSK